MQRIHRMLHRWTWIFILLMTVIAFGLAIQYRLTTPTQEIASPSTNDSN